MLNHSFLVLAESISSKKIECVGCRQEIQLCNISCSNDPYNIECDHTICTDCVTEQIYKNNIEIWTCESCGSKIDTNELFKFFIQSWKSKIINVFVLVIFFNTWRLGINCYELFLIIQNKELFISCDTKNWFLFTITCGANLIISLYTFIQLAYYELIKKNIQRNVLLNRIFIITFVSQLFDSLFTLASIACSLLDTTSDCAKILISTIPEYWIILNVHFYVPLILLALIIMEHIYHLCSIMDNKKICTRSGRRRPTVCDILFSSKFNKINLI
jgi:hypothetical protein